MKKLVILILAISLVLCACAPEEQATFEDGEVLLSIDGQAIMNGEDINLALKEAELQNEVYGTDADEDFVFELYAETRILAYLADEYKIEVDEEYYEATWNAYLSELKEDESRAEELGMLLATMDALLMNEEQYSEYVVAEYILNAKVEEFIAFVASDFSQITDPYTMTQTVKENIAEIVRIEGLECFYPGKESYFPSFEYTVGE